MGAAAATHAVAATTAGTATYTGTETIPVPPASAFAGSGGGDGWAVALSSTQVFNVFHHQSVLQVACHNQSDATSCWSPETITDSSGDNFAVSGQPGLWLDQHTGHLFVFATRSVDDTGGVVCIDTTIAATNTDPFCGFTPLSAVGGSPLGSSGISAISDPQMVGTHWYAFNYVNGATVSGSENTLLCFDTQTLAPCSGQPFTVPVNSGTISATDYPPPALAAIGHQVLVPMNVGGSDEISCFDATTLAGCAGSWPINLSSSYSSQYGAAFPLLTANGTVTGFCLPTGTDPCYGLDGSSVATPSGLPAAVTATSGWNGSAFVLGPRVYVPNGNSDQIDCFDAATNASCAGFPFVPSNLELLYTVNPDPQRPTCLWINSDGGGQQIQDFDAYSAGSCGQGPIRVLASDLVAPSAQCVPYNYTSLKVTSPPPSAYSGGTVGFQDPDGNDIAGTSTMSLDGTGGLSLAGLSLNTAIGLPEFLITLNGAASIPSAVTVQVTWTGLYDPACTLPDLTVVPPASAPPVVTPTPHKTYPSHLLSRKWKRVEIAGNSVIVAGSYLGCGGLIAAAPDTAHLSRGLAAAECGLDADAMASLMVAIKDPPDSRFAHVYKPAKLPAGKLTFGCKLSAHACAQVHALVAAQAAALAKATSLSEAVAVTIDRYTTAVHRGRFGAAARQRKAEMHYLPLQKKALATYRKKLHALTAWLVAHGTPQTVTAKQVVHARAHLIALKRVSKAMIHRVVHLRLVSSRRGLTRAIAASTKRAGHPKAGTLMALLKG